MDQVRNYSTLKATARLVRAIFPKAGLAEVVADAARLERMTDAERQSALFYMELDEADRAYEEWHRGDQNPMMRL